jgi:hypothetical protein
VIRKAVIRRPSRSRERTALHQLYAAKIAAARLTADRRELAAIIAALRSEERAALDVLKARFAAAPRSAGNCRSSLVRAHHRWRPRCRKKGGADLPAPLK